MAPHLVLIPATVWRDIHQAGWAWGTFNIKVTGDVAVITHIWDQDKEAYAVIDGWLRTHHTYYADVNAGVGAWYHADPLVHQFHDGLYRRAEAAIDTAHIAGLVPNGWQPPGPEPMLVITYSMIDGEPVATAWSVNDRQAVPLPFSVVDDSLQPLDQIAAEWPVAHLQTQHVTVVGVGSIGSVAAETLAAAGVGKLSLIDFDRLEQRNLPRHRLSSRDLGRLKVDAMSEQLRSQFSSVEVNPYALDVAIQTDQFRPIVDASDVVLCSSDGVASRRVTNHVARRANRPLVLAAVLADGGYGELIRVHPRTGCLLCLRKHQVENGKIDPEPGIDLGYGTGDPHRPMTAAPNDLTLVGTFAAKLVISQLLVGLDRRYELAGDYAVLALQPRPDLAAPFDLERSGDLHWDVLPARDETCPTCAPAT